MPKHLKHPGLQPKFEKALQEILSNGSLSGNTILQSISSQTDKFKISPNEFQDLQKNFANYILRAKQAGIVHSNGTWSGYHLNHITPGANAQIEENITGSGGRRSNEAAMHFVATCALSIQFGSRIISLPTAVDRITWGNADMLMLRANPSHQRFEDSDLDPSLLKLVDSSPECILSSIELKYNLNRNRRAWFQAISETAANSRWANEGILVHVNPDPESRIEPLDDEVISLARIAEVGIIEFSTIRQDSRSILDTRIIVAPLQRSYLRLGDLAGNRSGLIQEAHNLLKLWYDADSNSSSFNNAATFLDVEDATPKLLQLLTQAIRNLRRQDSFQEKSMAKALASLQGDLRISELFAAALNIAANSTYIASNILDAKTRIKEDSSHLLNLAEWDKFHEDFCALMDFSFNNL